MVCHVEAQARVKSFLWALAALVLAVAAFATYRAFTSPGFVLGLAGAAVAAMVRAAIPAWKAIKAKHTPEEWQALREKRRREMRGGDR